MVRNSWNTVSWPGLNLGECQCPVFNAFPMFIVMCVVAPFAAISGSILSITSNVVLAVRHSLSSSVISVAGWIPSVVPAFLCCCLVPSAIFLLSFAMKCSSVCRICCACNSFPRCITLPISFRNPNVTCSVWFAFCMAMFVGFFALLLLKLVDGNWCWFVFGKCAPANESVLK